MDVTNFAIFEKHIPPKTNISSLEDDSISFRNSPFMGKHIRWFLGARGGNESPEISQALENGIPEDMKSSNFCLGFHPWISTQCVSIFPSDPWDGRYSYLHEWLIFIR